MNNHRLQNILFIAALILVGASRADVPPGEAPALAGHRVSQVQIANGDLSLQEIRAAGMRIFATPFNKLDGYGDGPMNVNDKTSPGGRPTLQGNGTFLRVNGLDAQNCQECHSVGSSASVPFRFAVGGAGSANNNAMFQPTQIDVDDSGWNYYAFFNGRFINPPFLFGSGGVELLGKEMTASLQKLKATAQQTPGVPVPLVTHGVDFGSIRYDASSGQFDTSGVDGIDADLVVRPFGRKGEFATVRAFDVEALAFHMGLQPVESVGADVDADGDGVFNEVSIGELSALHIFNTNLEPPQRDTLSPQAQAGSAVFADIGCAACHVPEITTRRRWLTYSFPEDHTQPYLNTFLRVDLSRRPARFERYGRSGLRIPLFSDLKRHDMGDGLAESFNSALDREFITARLWGIADTAPYLHDGRALTLTDAIEEHGGEAQAARDGFVAASDAEKIALLAFLRTLRTPENPAKDLLNGERLRQKADAPTRD